jgi:hypothetical protein
MIAFKDITITGIDGIGDDINLVKSLKYSKQFFPNAKLKLISAESSVCDIEYTKIQKLNYDEYSKFCLTEWYKYIDTTFMLNCHEDGFVVNPTSWTDEFLDYDYIGSPWPNSNLERSAKRWKLVESAYNNSNKTYCIGNGGFSLRTKKLMKMVSKLYLDEYYGIPEDLVISVILRKQLEDQGFKFPTNIQFAGKFSCEAKFVDGYVLSSDTSLGFHCGETHPQKVKLLETIL